MTENSFETCVLHMVNEFEHAYKGNYGMFDKGDVASIRRMDVSAPSHAFWRLTANSKVNITDANQRGWALVAKCMAIMAPKSHSKTRPGIALRQAGFSAHNDIRISRLLKSEGPAFEHFAVSLARFLSAKQQSLNWVSFAYFLLLQDEKSRSGIARDFFSSISSK